MPVATVDLVIKQGSVFHKGWTWCLPSLADPDVPDLDRPMDLTGYTARAQIRRAQQDVDGMLEFTTEDDKIVLGGADGHILIDLLATDTDLLNQKKMFWDLELIPPDGSNAPDLPRTFAIMQGKVVVQPNYTQTDGQEIVE